MNLFTITLPATCQFRNIPTPCGIRYVVWDLGQPVGAKDVDKLYSLAKLITSRCDLSQSEGTFVAVQGLWDELAQPLIGFSCKLVLLCTPISMWWSAGALPRLCMGIRWKNRLNLH